MRPRFCRQGLKTGPDADEAARSAYEQLQRQLLGAYPGHLPLLQECLTRLAAAGVDLFGGPAATRVRECASPTCALLFLDDSRSGARRWCAMDDCGTRSKMRTYRARAAQS